MPLLIIQNNPVVDALDAEDRAAGRASEADYLDGLRKVCTSWRKLLNADPVHGRRVLRDLRIDRVPVRQDERGRWWFRLEGNFDKILGITGRDFAVTDTPFVPWAESDCLCRVCTDEFGETDDPADDPAEYQEGSCPRQGWHTGPRALRGRVFKLGAYLSLPA